MITIIILAIFVTNLHGAATQNNIAKKVLPPVITHGGDSTTCGSMEQQTSALLEVNYNVFNYIFKGSIVPECGEGFWYQVAYLNMTDSSQCPSTWWEYNRSQFRACGRPTSAVGSCPAKFYPTNRVYSKVCGRVIAIQVASPDGFARQPGVNDSYLLDGLIITYGSPRKHIWSYVGGFSEVLDHSNGCPCAHSSATPPPSFVSNNYYCESGNPGGIWIGKVFPNDKLWDGEQCSHEGTCCTGANTPPWFSVDLDSLTSADIEIRICGDESTTNEDTPIQLLEIYIQ